MIFDPSAAAEQNQESLEDSEETASNQNRYIADTAMRDSSCVVTLYGSPLHVTPPLVVHGAMLSYVARLEKRSVYEVTEQTNSGRDVPRLSHTSQLTLRLSTLRDSTIYDSDFYR